MLKSNDTSRNGSGLFSRLMQRGDEADFSKSLPEAYRTLNVWQASDGKRPWFRRMLGFAGPGFLVAVGYIDPGNWGTDLAGAASSDTSCCGSFWRRT